MNVRQFDAQRVDSTRAISLFMMHKGQWSPTYLNPNPRQHTPADGCLVIYEGTGPPPCNTHKLLLPNRPGTEVVDTGCNNKGTFEHTFVVSGATGTSECVNCLSSSTACLSALPVSSPGSFPLCREVN